MARFFLLVIASLIVLHAHAQAPRHVYLTWQGSTSTTMTVNAQTDAAVRNVTVFYDTEPRAGDVDAYRHRARGTAHQIEGLRDGRWIHWIELTDLVPEQPYYFVVGSERGVSEERAFRTVPARDEPLRFIAGGDLGVNDEMRRLLRHAAAYGPHFALIGGDIAYVNGNLGYVRGWDAWLDAWEAHMVTPEGYTIPMVLAAGNHEVRGGYDGGPERAPFYIGFFAQPGEPSYFRMSFGTEAVVYVMDSGHIVPHEDQADWLAAHLRADQDVPHRFAAYHVPLYPSHRAYEGFYSRQGRRHWAPLFDRYGLTTAFEHHDHTFKRSKRLQGGAVSERGTLYLGDGAWGKGDRPIRLSPRWYLDKAGATRHAWVVDVTPDGVNYRAFDVTGNLIDVYPTDAPEAAAADAYFSTLPQLYALSKESLTVTPLPADVEPFERATVGAVIHNGEVYPASVELWFETDAPLRAEPAATTLTLAPGDSVHLRYDLHTAAPLQGEKFPKAVLRAAYAFARNAPERKDTIRVTVARRLATEQAFEAPPRRAAVTIDGKFDEWPRLPYRFTEPAAHEEEPRGWTGPQDGSLHFAAAHDADYLYLALSVTDDRLELAAETSDWDPVADRPTRDGVSFWLDPHPGGEGDDDPYFMIIPVSVEEGARVLVTDGDHRALAIAVRTAARKTETGYDIEVMLPKRVLWDEREGPLEALRLNLALSDLDEHGTPPDVLYWRPQWESAEDYLGSGVIALRP